MIGSTAVFHNIIFLLRGFGPVALIVGLVYFERHHSKPHIVGMPEWNRLRRELTRGSVKRILAAKSSQDLLVVAQALTATERVLVAWWVQDQPPQRLRLERRDRIMAALYEAVGEEIDVGTSAADVPRIQ